MATFTGADRALGFLFDIARNIADDYDNTSTYAQGAYTIYAGTLYKCTTLIQTPEDFNIAHWQSVLIMDEVAAGGGGGGGTTVIANPAGAATDTLDKLQVGATIYDVPSGGGSSGHTYSTTEQIVGTWIDGSTVYEKSIALYNVAYTTINTQYEIMQIPNIALPISISAVFSNSSKTIYHHSPYVATDANMKKSYFDFDMTNSRIFFISQDTWGSTNIFVTARYTKTV